MPTIISSAVLLIGTVSAGDPSIAFDPVFECYRLNYAWGFSMSGTAVGRDGTLVRYRLRDKDLSPTLKKNDGMTFEDESNLRGRFIGTTPSGTVDAEMLRNNIDLIGDAAKGKVNSAPTGVRDAGISTCHAYILDAGTHRYRDIELGSDGAVSDTHVDNDAKAAATLLDWLKAVGVATK